MASLVLVEPGLDTPRTLLDTLEATWLPLAGGSLTIVDVTESGLGEQGLTEVDGFLQSVGADEDVTLVLMVASWEGCDGRLASAVETVRRRAVLWRLRTWVVGQHDPEAPPSTGAFERLFDVRGETSLDGVLVVSWSTVVKAQTHSVDRAGIMADCVWALTVGRLAEHVNAFEDLGAWYVGTTSFTSWAPRAGADQVARAVSEVLERGALGRLDTQLLAAYEERGAQWVRDRGIGSAEELARLTSDSRGDLYRLLELEDHASLLAPDSWATSIDRDYLTAAAAPLGRFKRQVRGNVREQLYGRDGEPSRGHRAALLAAVDDLLREEAGVKKASRFLNGVHAELVAVSRRVANTERDTADAAEVAMRRADLVKAVEVLPEPRPWFVRSAVIVALVTVVTISSRPATAAIVGSVSALALGLLLIYRRWRAQNARVRYQKAATEQLELLAQEFVFGEWSRMVAALITYCGSFRGPAGEIVDIEQTTEPPPDSLAARLLRLWQAALAAREGLTTETERSAAPDGGAFMRFYPTNDRETRGLEQAEAVPVTAAVNEARQQAQDTLSRLTLAEAEPSRLLNPLTDLLHLAVWTLPLLLTNVPAAQDAAVAAVGAPNSPAVNDQRFTLRGTVTWTCASSDVLHALRQGISIDEHRAAVSSDVGRVVRLTATPAVMAPPPAPLDLPPRPSRVAEARPIGPDVQDGVGA